MAQSKIYSKQFVIDKQEWLDNLSMQIGEYEELIKSVSIKHWRTTSTHYQFMKKMYDEVEKMDEISEEELSIPWVKKELGI